MFLCAFPHSYRSVLSLGAVATLRVPHKAKHDMNAHTNGNGTTSASNGAMPPLEANGNTRELSQIDLMPAEANVPAKAAKKKGGMMQVVKGEAQTEMLLHLLARFIFMSAETALYTRWEIMTKLSTIR